MPDHDRAKLWLLVILLAAAVAYSFWYAFKAWTKNRLVQDTPTSRIRSAAQGYVELSGQALPMPDSQTKGPLTGIPCAWWRYKVEERRRSGRSLSWFTLQGDTSDAPFLLDDGTGTCMIDPRGAEVYPGATDVWYGPDEWPQVRLPSAGWLVDHLFTDKYRYTEYRLSANKHVLAIGALHCLGGAGVEDSEAAMAELLRQWKKDQRSLLARFDSNHDGVLGADEWDRARAAARQEVLDGRAAKPQPPTMNVLAEPADGRSFLLAAAEGDALAARYRLRAAAAIVVFLCGSAALAWVLKIV
jgi:hypothetical protein